MTQTLKEKFNENLNVPNDYDLRMHHNLSIAGTIDVKLLNAGSDESLLYRPRDAAKPHTHVEALNDAPESLAQLYNIAAKDMRKQGIEPNALNMHLLYQSGDVEPQKSLRAGFWHFDLTRLLRSDAPKNHMPLCIGYAVSSVLPTIYLSRLISDDVLPARETISNEDHNDALAADALLNGYIFRPQAGEVVRYDNLTMHRGAPNDGAKKLHRVFMHIGFSSP